MKIIMRSDQSAYQETFIYSRHCFSLASYGFCISSALYSESLSFRMFFFLLAPFDHSWQRVPNPF